MGSYENIVKIEEIKKKTDEQDMQSAMKILETMDIRKIRNITDLSLIAEVYAENERYEEAEELYYKIYEKTHSRKSLYRLIDILLKLNNAEEAESYLSQYKKLAPEDFYNYVFRYKIAKIKGETFEHLIGILEELKKTEYTEKWAYELAKLYYKAGMEAECIRECSDIVLWFGEGTYVEKAKILRSYYSGETGKDQIMDEIKRRAEEVGSQSTQERGGQEQSIQENKAAEEESAEDESEDYEETSEQGNSYELEENLYNGSDFLIHEDADEFEDGLKKDVRSILTDEQEDEAAEDSSSTYLGEEELPDQEEAPSHENTYYEEKSYYEEKTYYEETREPDEDTEAFRKEAADTYDIKTNFEQEDNKEKELSAESAVNMKPREENLTEEDKKLRQISKEFSMDTDEIFGNFLHVMNIKRQLVKSLDMILRDRSKNSMMIITGIEGSGKTTLAKDFALFFYKSGKLKSSKAAKIKADKLNTVDILSKKDTLKDCCLVIENASELKRQTIEDLLELMHGLPGQLAVVFEENKKNMNKLFRECPKLMDLLKNRIHLPQYNQLDLMGFVYSCLRQKEYRLNQKAEQILQNKISQIVKQYVPEEYLEQINILTQSAMEAADLRIGKQISDLANQGRLRDVEVLTILAEDIQN